MDPSIADFISYISSEKGLARNTIEAYGRDLKAFHHSLKGKSFKEAGEKEVIDFLSYLKENGYASASVYRTLIAIKVFFRFLKREGMVEQDATLYLDSPKLWQLIPEVLSVGEVTRLLNAPDPASMQGARDRAILKVLYASGLRVSEVCGLDICDVDDRFVRVKGKGGKERMVPIAEEAVEAVDHYLTHFRKGDAKALFLNGKGEGSTGWRSGTASKPMRK